MQKTISIIIPIHNEEKNIPLIYDALKQIFASVSYDHELIFVNDGSQDGSQTEIKKLADLDSRVKAIEFSRNFGKEAATTAGFHHASGDAVMAIDADLQHPPVLIPQFIEKWEAGIDVVIGVRDNNASDSIVKKLGSTLYYKLINSMSETIIVPRATDFRLLDRMVVDEFKKLTEHNRMTRGLIDWLGFRRDYVYFDAPEREHGEASYDFWKLMKLAAESFISHSLLPLRLAGYLGLVITFFSGMLGVVMFVDRYMYSKNLDFSGTAILADIILFLVGIILMALGLLAFYIANIYHETQNRPLYVTRKRK